MAYVIEQNTGNKLAYRPYGAAADLWICKAREVMISGPSETGKTLATLHKLDAMCWKYPNLHAIVIRKVKEDMYESVLKTYQDKVLLPNSPVNAYGGSRPQHFDYPNGSRIVVAGLDKPGKALSAEYDVILTNQTEQLTLNDWETLTTRCTGRAGNMPYSQLIGDCNPGRRNHWILERANEKKLIFLESRHEDNPTLFNPQTGKITEQGKITLGILDNLTGVRYQRLRAWGNGSVPKGQIYSDYDPAIQSKRQV